MMGKLYVNMGGGYNCQDVWTFKETICGLKNCLNACSLVELIKQLKGLTANKRCSKIIQKNINDFCFT